MKIYQKPTYTELVRIELKDLKTKEIRSISFCQTTLEEVIEHVNNRLKTGIIGIKVSVNIRISDKEKRWGKQKNIIVYIKDLDTAIRQIKADVPTINMKEITE